MEEVKINFPQNKKIQQMYQTSIVIVYMFEQLLGKLDAVSIFCLFADCLLYLTNIPMFSVYFNNAAQIIYM